MAKSQQSFNKREREKIKLKKQKEKQQRREERKANSSGGGLDDMIAYVDENGNITDTPPDPSQRTEVDVNSIEIGISRKEDEEVVDTVRTGKVDFFNQSKGFGFIIDDATKEKYFFHFTNLLEPVIETDAVTFELEKGAKGMNAVQIKKKVLS